MPIARRVQLYAGYPSFEVVDSEREYVEHRIDTTARTEYDTDDFAVRVFYQDDETGIITTDVAKFEAWMRTVVTK